MARFTSAADTRSPRHSRMALSGTAAIESGSESQSSGAPAIASHDPTCAWATSAGSALYFSTFSNARSASPGRPSRKRTSPTSTSRLWTLSDQGYRSNSHATSSPAVAGSSDPARALELLSCNCRSGRRSSGFKSCSIRRIASRHNTRCDVLSSHMAPVSTVSLSVSCTSLGSSSNGLPNFFFASSSFHRISRSAGRRLPILSMLPARPPACKSFA